MVVVVFLLLCGLHNEAANMKFRNGRQFTAYVCHPGGIADKLVSKQAIYAKLLGVKKNNLWFKNNYWFQLEDMFQLIVTPQGIGKVMIQLKDTPSKVYAIGAELFLSKVPLEVLQN